MHHPFSICRFKRIQHPTVVACADVTYAGLTLRGLKLERSQAGSYRLGTPGRKIGGQWQVVVEVMDPSVEEQLTGLLSRRYRERAA